MKTIHLIAGARPNFMKVAPLYHALTRETWCAPVLMHTGQHYDTNMAADFFRDLALPDPDISLGVGSGTHAEQTAKVMMAYEAECLTNRPDAIVVVGDVNSTLACSIVAAKLQIFLVHLEAGLRSKDRAMPEEINRILTDAAADLLWTPSLDANENLLREGIGAERIECIGNIMIDSFELRRREIEKSDVIRQLGLLLKSYGVVTLHRPSNVDDESTLRTLVEQLINISTQLPLVFPVHPRTRRKLEVFGQLQKLSLTPKIKILEPLGYIDFMSLLKHARFVLTDSGGLQEESTYLHIPCMTVRESTERPITIELGTNRLVGPCDVEECVSEILSDAWPTGKIPELWDGDTAPRAVQSLRQWLVD